MSVQIVYKYQRQIQGVSRAVVVKDNEWGEYRAEVTYFGEKQTYHTDDKSDAIHTLADMVTRCEEDNRVGEYLIREILQENK